MTGRLRQLLLEQVLKTSEGFEALEVFLSDPTQERAARFKALWKEAFLRARAVDRALEGPQEGSGPDREGAFALTRALEEMLFSAKSVVEDLPRLGVGSDRFLRDMARAASGGCRDLAEGVRGLEARPRASGEAVIRAKKSQRRVAELARRATDNVLRHPNAVETLRTREIYRHFASAADRGDAAAEAVGGMLVSRAP